jgi:hypothetical protein
MVIFVTFQGQQAGKPDDCSGNVKATIAQEKTASHQNPRSP